MLRRRPQPGVVFDRFTSAWLATGDRTSLKEFLKKKAGAAEATAADHLILALSYSATGEDAEALKACENAAAKAPDDALLQLRTAEIANRLRQWDTALNALTRAAQIGLEGENDIRATRLHTDILWRLGRPGEAKQNFANLIKRHPDELSLREELVDMLVENGLTAEAAEESRTLVDLSNDPFDKAMRRLRLAELLVNLRRTPLARTELDLSLAQSGMDSWLEGETLDRMERLYRRSGDISGFATKLAELAKQHPTRVSIARRQMRILSELARPVDASAIAIELLKRTPGRRDIREDYITLLEAQGKIAEAIQQMEELLRQQSKDSELMLRLAGLHGRNNAPDRTRALVDLFLKQSPDDEGAVIQAGRLLERLSLDNSARDLYEKWMLAHPLDPLAGLSLAALLHRQGDKESAIQLWRTQGAQGDITTASQVATAASNRGEMLVAFEILKPREKELLDDPRLVMQICSLAMQARQETDSLRWLRRYSQLVKETGELQRLSALALSALTRKSTRQQLLQDFAQSPPSGTGEKILLTLTHEFATPENTYDEQHAGRRRADDLLRQAWSSLPHPADAPLSGEEALVESAWLQVLQRRRDWPGMLAVLGETVTRPAAKTSARLQSLVEASAAALNYEKALRWVAEWKAVVPTSYIPWRMHAKLLGSMGKTEERLSILREAAQRFHEQDEMPLELASALSAADQGDEALAVYRRLFEQKEDPSQRLRIGAQMVRTAKNSDQLEDLLTEWKRYQREHADSPEPWRLLAMAYREKPDVEAHCNALTEALRLTPNDIDLMRELALSEDARGNPEKAAELYRQAARKESTPQAKRAYAEFLLKRGESQEALQIMQEIMAAQSTTVMEVEELASHLLTMRLWREAATLLEESVKNHTQQVRLQYLRGVALEESGRLEEAAQHFTRILLTQEELVDATPLPPLTEPIPMPEAPGAAWWYRLLDHGEKAYLYRGSKGSAWNIITGSSGTPSRQFHMPQCLEEAQVFALRHLVRLSEVGRVQSPPRPPIALPDTVPMADVWNNLILRTVQGFPEPIVTAGQLRIHPFLLAEWLRGRLRVLDLPEAEIPTLLLQAEKFFAQSHPDLAAEAAMLQALADASDLPGAPLDRALEHARRSTTIGRECLAEIAAALIIHEPVSGFHQLLIRPGAALSKQGEDRLLAALTTWAKEAAASDATPATLLGYAARTLSARGHWTAWKDLLDDALARIRENHAALDEEANAGRYGDFYFELPFPPSIYSGYSVRPSDCLHTHDAWHGGATAERAPASLAAEAREPLTKLLCLHAAGLKAELKQEALRLAKVHPERDDVIFLKASVLASDGESEELARTLHQWMRLPVSRDVQQARARHLLEIAVNGSLPTDDTTQTIVTDAVKDLIARNAWDARFAQDTAEALKAANFVQAGQLLSGAVVQTNPSTHLIQAQKVGVFLTRTAQDLMRRVDGISDGGAALRVLTETLRQYADDEIAMANGYGHHTSDSGWDWLRQALEKKTTFRESILSHLLSEAGTPRLSHAEAAFIMQQLSYSSRHSKEHYLKALEDNPADTPVRLRMVYLLLHDDPAAARTIYETAPVEDRLFIGHSLCKGDSRNLMLTQIVSKFACSVLQQAASQENPPLDLNWLNALTGNLCWSVHGSRQSGIDDLLLVEPFVAEAGFGSTPSSEFVELSSRYDLTSDLEALCDAAMKVPDLAVSAFSTYAGLKLKKGASPELLAPKAREALQTQVSASGWFPGPAIGRHLDYEPSCIWQPSPLALLAAHAARQPDTSAAFKELTTLAQTCKVQEGARIVAALERLYTCKESDFPAAVRELESLPYVVGHRLDSDPATTAARVWRDRGLNLDPSFVLLPKSRERITRSLDTSACGIVLQAFARRGEREKAEALLAKLMEHELGPRTEWKEFVKSIGSDFMDPRSQALDTLHLLMHNISQAEPLLCFLSFELAEEAGLRLNQNFRAEYFMPSWMERGMDYTPHTERAKAAILSFLAGSPWLKPDSPLWDCPMHSTDEETLLTLTARAIKNLPKDQQADIRATLEHAAAKNSGAAVLHSLVLGDQQRLVDAMILANATIKESASYSVKALSVIAETELAPNQQATVKARAPEIEALLQKLENSEAASNAAAFFTASDIESLDLTDSEFEETLRRAATQLAAIDHATAVKLLDRGCALMEKKHSNGTWTGSNGSNGWTPCGEVLKQWCDKTPSLDVVAVACDLFHQPDEFNAVSAGWWHCPSWGNALATAWLTAGGQGDPSAGLAGLLHTLHSKLTIKHAPLLIPAFMDFHLKLDPWQRQEVLLAADALAMKKSEISQYAAWVGLAFRLNELADGALWLPGSQDPERIRKVMEGFRAVITDVSVNPLVRLAVAHNLMNRAGKHADPETIWAAMDLATLALENEWPAHGYMMLSILNTVNRLPADDRYKTAAARWLTAWLKRNQHYGSPSLNYNPVDEYQSAVLTLAARGLDDTGLRQALQSISGVQQRSSTNLLTLIRHDRFAVAQEFFMQSKDMLLRASHNNVQPEDTDMPKITAFAEKLPDPDQRLQVMVYCNSFYGFGMLRDQWADSRALSWNRRMADLARAVMEHGFKDQKLRDTLMTELADAPAAVEVMAPELREKDLRSLVRTSSFGSGRVPISESLRYPMELAFLSLANRIRQTAPVDLEAAGSVFPGPLPQPANGAQLDFQTLLERVDSGRDSRSKAECMRQIEGNLFEATMLAAPSMESTLLAGFIPAWNKILRAYSDEKERFEEEALGVATQIVLAGLSGKITELLAWREDVPHYRRDSLKAQFLTHRHLMSVAQQLCRTQDGKWRKFEERWKLVQAFAADPWVLEYMGSSRDTIMQLVRNRVLTVEEAMAHGDELASMFPKDGRVAAELAALMKVQGRDDEVPKLLALAVEQAKDSEEWHAEWGLRLVRWKTEHRQREDALKLWEEIKSRAKEPTLKKAVEAARPAE